MRTAYLRALFELAEENKNVFALIADNGAIVFDEYRNRFPDQFLNLGIAEANMLAVAAGMSCRGKIPFAYTIGAFMAYRAFEFIRDDICLQDCNVKIVGTGAGESYSALGATHHTTEDLGALRSLPNMTILSPTSPREVYWATKAAYSHKGPVYMRIGTNKEREINEEMEDFSIGKANLLRCGTDLSVIVTGGIAADVLDVVDQMTQESGASIRVISMSTIKPFDSLIVQQAVDETKAIITMEDHNIIGGLGSAVSEVIAEYGKSVKFARLGLEDFSHGYGKYEDVKNQNRIGKKHIRKAIQNAMEEIKSI